MVERKDELVAFNGVKVESLMVERALGFGRRVALVLFKVALGAEETNVGAWDIIGASADEGDLAIEVADGPFYIASTFDFNGIAQAGE